MGFWGVEVKPGKPHPYHSDNVRGKLHVAQATLGLGSSAERTILQCSVGDKSPIFLSSLLPNKNESCSLNLQFDEDDLVAFSVIGPRSIHLSGYFVADNGDHLRDEYDSDSYGEDIMETETDESSEFNTEDEYDDDFIEDDNDELLPLSHVPNSGVVIEEIVDDDKPLNGNDQSKRMKKKDDLNDSDRQTVVKTGAGVPVLESEDEDGFPISTSHRSNGPEVEVEKQTDKSTTGDTEKKKAKDSSDPSTSKKRKVKTGDQDNQPERKKKTKKQKEKGANGKVNQAANGNETNDLPEPENQNEVNHNIDQKAVDNDTSSVPSENQSDKRKKKKKKKAKESEGERKEHPTSSAMEDKNDSVLSSEQMQTPTKSSKVRTYPNGLVIEEVAMGKPDGKRASPGKQVSVRYIGKLKNGKIFDSNVGRAPFKFRLGIGQVIKGWDVGVNGMRVGDKRKLTIPPSMGYGAKGAGGQIPPNSWLVFDVELIDVR